MPKYDALARARRVDAKPNQNTTTNGPSYYVVDDRQRQVLAGPAETREDVVSILDGERLGADDRVVEIKEGTTLVQAEPPAPRDGEEADEGAGPDCWFVINDNFSLQGEDIRNPEQQFDQGPGGQGAPNVTFEFSEEGRRIWQEVTRSIAERGLETTRNQHFAIVLDNELISTPFIDFRQNPDGIDGANGSQISGGFTIQSAQRLANLLKTGALPIDLELISQSQVSATLGQEALDQGIIAAAVGFAIVAAFLLFFYRVLGLIAVLALAVYAVYFFALIRTIPIVLTLPGIAGLVLTIGVTADANIVIFERVKEEIRNGRSVQAGIAQGYKKGITAIIDANVVTFMTAFILFILATAGVKGFAFVLGIGTLVTVFTAVLMTQAVLGSMGRSRLISHPSLLGATKKKREFHFDFVGYSKYFFSASGVILLIGALAIGGRGLEFGIDFESGTRIRAGLEQPATEAQLRTVLERENLADAEIQRITDDPELGANVFQVSTEQLPPEEVARVTGAIDRAYGIRGSPDTQSIGPTFGDTVARSALIAVIASLLVIGVYIALRFEWKYAVPVLIAIMHDILITAGVYSLTGREVTTSTVAALLTILGFSLYDTIIVFDRIRENVPRMPRAAFSQIVNRSMREVIVRSLATTFCTALPIFSLLLFGGETLKDFAFALLVGLISGTYSSIFIAAPVLTLWKEREPVYQRRIERIRAQFGGLVPAFATAVPGGTAADVDVEPERPKKATRSLFTPDDPRQGVSRTEFDEMVRDLPIDEPAPAPAPAAGSVRADDLSPEDLVMKDDKPKRDKSARGPRNKRHGRPR
jgi:SecD/SecF fusion protein